MGLRGATADLDADVSVGVGTRRTVRYRVRRRDLASWIYRCLGWSRRKPGVLATARLLWLAELAVMPAIPGVSLGHEQLIEHLAPTVRGARVTVTAECTDQRGRDWQWSVVVRDKHQMLGRCTLWFVGEVDRKRYTARRLAPKLAARPIGIVCWLAILDALTLALVLAIPAQAAYVWQHGWMLATESALTVVWSVTLMGLPGAISDWVTVRPLKVKEIPPEQLGAPGAPCQLGWIRSGVSNGTHETGRTSMSNPLRVNVPAIPAELRRQREQTGRSREVVATAMEWGSDKLRRIESGLVGISVVDLRALLGYYRISTSEEVEAMANLVRKNVG